MCQMLPTTATLESCLILVWHLVPLKTNVPSVIRWTETITAHPEEAPLLRICMNKTAAGDVTSPQGAASATSCKTNTWGEAADRAACREIRLIQWILSAVCLHHSEPAGTFWLSLCVLPLTVNHPANLCFWKDSKSIAASSDVSLCLHRIKVEMLL